MRPDTLVHFVRNRRIWGQKSCDRSSCDASQLFENKFQFNKRFHQQKQRLLFREAILSSSLDFVCQGDEL